MQWQSSHRAGVGKERWCRSRLLPEEVAGRTFGCVRCGVGEAWSGAEVDEMWRVQHSRNHRWMVLPTYVPANFAPSTSYRRRELTVRSSNRRGWYLASVDVSRRIKAGSLQRPGVRQSTSLSESYFGVVTTSRLCVRTAPLGFWAYCDEAHWAGS